MNANSNPFVAHGYGEGASWQDLVNSEHWDGFGHFTDMLDKPEWVNSFLDFRGFRVPSQDPFPLEEFRALRSLLRKLVEKAANGKKVRLEQLAPLNDWMKVRLTPRLEEDQNGLRISLETVQWLDYGAWQYRLFLCAILGCLWPKPAADLPEQRLPLDLHR